MISWEIRNDDFKESICYIHMDDWDTLVLLCCSYSFFLFSLNKRKSKTLLSWLGLIWYWAEQERNYRSSCWWKQWRKFLTDLFHRISSVCAPLWACIEFPPGETSCEQSSARSSVESYYVTYSEVWDVGNNILCALCHLHLLQSHLSSRRCFGCKVLHSQWDSPTIILTRSSGLHHLLYCPQSISLWKLDQRQCFNI